MSSKIIPSFGVFTNTFYDIIGIMWFNKLYGICIKSKYNNLYTVGYFYILNQYHLSSDYDKKPQFVKKNKRLIKL